MAAGRNPVRCRDGAAKTAQTSTNLDGAFKLYGDLDEAGCMTTLSPALTSNDRRLVFTSSQAAEYLGVSLATIRRWTDAGHISCFRTPGGQRRFSRAQLDEFISSMQHDAPTSTGATAGTRAHVA
jgi:excisionase family DNA binding protein